MDADIDVDVRIDMTKLFSLRLLIDRSIMHLNCKVSFNGGRMSRCQY